VIAADLLRATMAIGFSEPVARRGLDAELAVWDDTAVRAQIEREVGAREPRPKNVLVIAARTLPASTMRQVYAARALGARVIVKSASGQEAIGEALAHADPQVVATPFASCDTAALDRTIGESDAVVVLGGDETVESVRARVPLAKHFVPHGHRASAAWLADDAPDDALRGLAEDLCAWDQAGCLAPQWVWVEGDVTRLMTRLAPHVEAVERALPMPPDPRVVHARRAASAIALTAGGQVTTTGTAMLATHPESRARGSPGHRFLWLLPASLDALTSFAPHLSTLGALAPPKALPRHTRLATPGTMQRPPLDWAQDGLPLFASLVRAH